MTPAGRTFRRLVCGAVVCGVAMCSFAQTTPAQLSPGAFGYLRAAVQSPQSSFRIFDAFDSAFNSGFLSGYFGATGKISVNPGCVYAVGISGCGSPESFDPTGTVIAVTFAPLKPSQGMGGPEYAGVFFQEPENPVEVAGRGYNLAGGSEVQFEGRADNQTAAITLTFSVGPEGDGSLETLRFQQQWQTVNVPILGDVANINNLLAISADGDHNQTGGTFLIRNITVQPTPYFQTQITSLPLSYSTFGVVPVNALLPGRVPVPIDQVLKNIAITEDSAITQIALLLSGQSEDLAAARQIADAFVYALHNDNRGLPIPPTKEGSRGLRNAYMGGNIALYNDQPPDDPTKPNVHGFANDVRLPGFSFAQPSSNLCGPHSYCLVLNGANGATNAMAILALVAASSQFERGLPSNQRAYLNAAREIGFWIHDTLVEPSPAGNYGGYWFGYPDNGIPPTALVSSKATADNAKIFAAFNSLSQATQLSDLPPGESSQWASYADIAALFVEQMYDPITASFYSGTIKQSDIATASGFGVIADGPRLGDDFINIYDFMDAQTMPLLALGPAGRGTSNWQGPVAWFSGTAKTIQVNGQSLVGFNLVQDPIAGPDGIGWEYTAQAVLAMRAADTLMRNTQFESVAVSYLNQLRAAQSIAPFSGNGGIVAASIQDSLQSDGSMGQPGVREQCISIPYQCVAARPSLGATAWAIFAERNYNPFNPEVQGTN